MGKVLGVICRAISTHLIHKAGYRLRDSATGAVTLIQRFGSALNMNIHFHVLFLDGVQHIAHAGGIVIGATTLTGQRRSAIPAPSQETLEKLRVKHGDLEEWWQKVFGYGFDFLTESEARYLFRSPDADRIREGIIAAARAGNQRDDAGDD